MLPDYRFMIAATFATVVFVILSFELLALVRFGHLPSALATIEERRFADDRPLASGPAPAQVPRPEPAVIADVNEPPQISAEERAQLANLVVLSAGITPKERGGAPVVNDSAVALRRDLGNGSRPLERDPLPIGGPLAEPVAEPPQITGSIGPTIPIPRFAADMRREREQAEARRRRARALALQRARAQALAAQQAKAREAQAAQNPFAALFGAAGGN